MLGKPVSHPLMPVPRQQENALGPVHPEIVDVPLDEWPALDRRQHLGWVAEVGAGADALAATENNAIDVRERHLA